MFHKNNILWIQYILVLKQQTEQISVSTEVI